MARASYLNLEFTANAPLSPTTVSTVFNMLIRDAPLTRPFSRLPQELLDLVIDILIDDCANDGKRREVLLVYTLVSQAWVHRCSKHILRRVFLTNAVLDRFASAVMSSPRLAVNVREVVLRDWSLESKHSDASNGLDKLLRATRRLTHLEMSWRSGQSTTATTSDIFDQENLPVVSPRYSIDYLYIESPPRSPLSSSFSFVTALVHALRLFKHIGTLELSISEDIPSLSGDDADSDVELLTSVFRTQLGSCAVTHLDVYIGRFTQSRIALAVAILRTFTRGAVSLKFSAHGGDTGRTPTRESHHVIYYTPSHR